MYVLFFTNIIEENNLKVIYGVSPQWKYIFILPYTNQMLSGICI